MKLYDCVNIVEKDGTFLLVPEMEYEGVLILLGFDGTEKWYRLQCREVGRGGGSYDYIATVMKSNGQSYSWDWGYSGYTLVSPSMDAKREKIVEACKEYCKRNGIEFPGKGW